MVRPARAFAHLFTTRNTSTEPEPRKIQPQRLRSHASSTTCDIAEKKTMSRLVPDGAGARMTLVSTVQLDEIWRHEVMSTLAVVEEILRETAVPMSVREIVERA